MRKILGLVLLIVCLGGMPCVAEATSPLQIFIQTDKSDYTVGEDINLTLYLYNAGKTPLKIYNPQTPGVTDIQVIDPIHLAQTPNQFKVDLPSFENFLTINPGEKITQEYKNMRWFPEEGGANVFEGKAQLPSAWYQIVLKLFMPPSNISSKDVPSDVWQGQLMSNIITIKIFEKGKTTLECTNCASR